MTLKSIVSILETSISGESSLPDQFSAGRVHGLKFALELLQEHMEEIPDSVVKTILTDPELYTVATSIMAGYIESGYDLEAAAEEFADSYQDERTPAGAPYDYASVLEAMIAIRRGQ